MYRFTFSFIEPLSVSGLPSDTRQTRVSNFISLCIVCLMDSTNASLFSLVRYFSFSMMFFNGTLKTSENKETIKPQQCYYTYGLLTKCEVKMAGYWPSSFFACLWTETKSRSINSQKKERGQYPAILTKQTWSIKDLLYGFW